MELCFIQWTNLRTETQDTESQIILRDCSCCWKMWWIWLLTSQKPINNPPYLMVVVQSLSGGRPNPMDCSTPGFPALRYTLELAQTHVHWVCWRCHPTISSSVVPFAFCFQSFPASGSFPMSRLSASVGQSIGASASASVLPVNIQGWFLSGLTGLISLQSVMRQVSFVFFFFLSYLVHTWNLGCTSVLPDIPTVVNPVCPRTHLWLCPLTSSEATLGNCQELKPDSQTQDSLSVPGSSFLTVAILPFPYTARFELAAHFCKNK